LRQRERAVSSPRDLAHAVCLELKRRKRPCPALPIVSAMLATTYFASLATEEGKPIIFDIVYLDPTDPDPNPPTRKPADRWSYAPLQKPIPLSVPNLSKLARATDPRSSSLVVHPDRRGTLTIWGLIDQGPGYHDFLNYDSESGPERPGLFQVSIANPGRIVANIGYAKIAELRLNALITKSSDVLRNGPVRKKLQPGLTQYVNSVRQDVGSVAFKERPDWAATLEDDWIATLCRLLLRTRAYRHGGAFLITADATEAGLDVKYRLNYSRLHTALRRRGALLITRTFAEDQISDMLDDDLSHIPASVFLDKEVAGFQLEETNHEIDGAVWFASLLSRVDGLVLMDPNLHIRGFGVEITDERPIPSVYRASTPLALPGRLRKLDYKEFGTRHRSMMRYVSAVQPSVGFVVSQDGDVRAITRHGKRVIIWEDIRLRLDDFVKREKPVTPLRSRRGA